MEALGFRKNFSWGLIGQTANVLSQFIIITCIARIGSIEDVGLYGIVSAIVSPLQLFFLMDIGKIIITEKEIQSKLTDLHFTFILNAFVLSTFSVIIVTIIYDDINTIMTTLGFAFYRAMTNYREFYFSIYQREERLDFMGKSLVNLALISIITFPIIYYFTNKLSISFFVLGIIYLITLRLSEIPNLRKVVNYNYRYRINWKKQKGIYLTGLSLGSTSFFTSFKSNIPRYIIEYGLKNREILGFYTLFAQCINVVGTINLTAAKSSMGRLTKLFYLNFKSFSKKLFHLSLLSFSGGILVFIIVYFFGDIGVSLLFGGKYIGSIYILNWLMLARIFVLPSTYLKVAQVLFSQIHIQLLIMLISVGVILFAYFILFKDQTIFTLLYSLLISELFVLTSTVAFVLFYCYKRNNQNLSTV